MSPTLRSVLPPAFLLVVLLAIGHARLSAVGPGAAPAEGASAISAEVRAATFTFAPGTAVADQQLFLAAVAGARPEARRLIEVVDGATEVGFGSGTAAEPLGLATSDGSGRYEVVVDLNRTIVHAGRRGISRVVLHELGHVVDYALLPDATLAELDRQIPAGYGCDAGQPTGSCAPVEERFAETFAKWATGDIGAALYVGYKVPPPAVSLEAWGAPLSRV